jgi:GcrA cell cycle regulator
VQTGTGARAARSAVDQPSRSSSRAGGEAADAGRAATAHQAGGGHRSARSLDARRGSGLGQTAGGTARLSSQRARVEQRGSASGCLWPIGDPGDADFHFCGAEPVPGKPYCEEHAARAYITRSRSERGEEAA